MFVFHIHKMSACLLITMVALNHLAVVNNNYIENRRLLNMLRENDYENDDVSGEKRMLDVGSSTRQRAKRDELGFLHFDFDRDELKRKIMKNIGDRLKELEKKDT